MPARVQRYPRRIGEHDVIGAGVEIPKPPRLACGLLTQRPEDGLVMLILPFTSFRQHHRGVGLEDRRDGRGDGPAN
jgi:hypothetical protein